MIKVIIIDDEYLVRERVKRCINWEKLGFEIVGESSNGKDAMELVETYKPEIAIVDINMPLMDGLEFSKIIHKKGLNTEIIILSGYNNFDFAKEALKAGAVDYLLKPINKDELIAILMDIKERIKKVKYYHDEIEKYKIQSRKIELQERQNFLESILTGGYINITDGDKVKLFEYCPKVSFEDDIFVIVVGIDRITEVIKDENEHIIWSFAIRNIFEEIFANDFDSAFVFDKNEKIVIISSIGQNRIIDDYIQQSKKAADAIKNHLGFTVSIGISRTYRGINKIGVSYKESLWSFLNSIIIGDGSICIFDALKLDSELLQKNFNIRKKMIEYLRIGDFEGITSFINNIFYVLKAEKMNINSLYYFISECLMAINEYYVEKSSWELDIETKNRLIVNPWDLINGKQSLIQLNEWLMTTIEKVFVMQENNKVYSSSEIKFINKITTYIDANYTNKELNLDIISKHVFLNKSYISHTFKKVKGISVVDYITEKRMLEAKKLLNIGNTTLDIIADRVGYKDPYYLSKCFKKYFGVPASKYIIRNQ